MAREIYQAVVDGILVGGVYALMAVGLTLIFGVLDIINIAQGVLVILGAYLSYQLSVSLHLDLFLGLLITVPAMFVIGVVIQWAFIRRLRGRERTSMTLLVTYAVALIIEGILYEIYGPNPKQLNASYVQSSVHIFGFYLPWIYLYGFALALILVAAIYALLYRTRFGRSVRATMQPRTPSTPTAATTLSRACSRSSSSAGSAASAAPWSRRSSCSPSSRWSTSGLRNGPSSCSTPPWCWCW